ncbi:MAG: universal stress protein [Pseudomonadota bacterium]
MGNQFKIMAAVDLSDYSGATVRYSLWLAGKMDAELLMVNVINQRDLDMVQRAMAGYGDFSFPSYLKEQEQERKERMMELYRMSSPGGIQCQFFTPQGIPYQVLLDVIEREKPNLLVMGTKGRSNLADVVVGSTATKMYRRSPIPLVMIPAKFHELP